MFDNNKSDLLKKAAKTKRQYTSKDGVNPLKRGRPSLNKERVQLLLNAQSRKDLSTYSSLKGISQSYLCELGIELVKQQYINQASATNNTAK